MTHSAGVKIVPAHLTWKDDAGHAREFRCFVKSEDYDFAAEVTRYPVEVGSNKTDNVRVAPREAKVVFFETNAPIDQNNWASPATGMQVIQIPAPSPQLPGDPLTFSDFDNLAQLKGIAAGGILQALGAVDDIVRTPTLLNAVTVVGAGLASGAGFNEIGSNLAAGTTAISVAKFAAAEAVLETPGAPIPQALPPPAPPAPVPPQVINQQTLAMPAQDYVALTVALLTQLQRDVQAVDLIAPHLTISNLIIEHIHVHRDADTGLGAEIEVSLTEIAYVSTTTVPAPAPSLPRAAAPVNKGEQGSEDASASARASIAELIKQYGKAGVLKLFHGLGG